MPAYIVEHLRFLGLYTSKCGQISSGEKLQVAEEPVWINFRMDGELLTIHSVADPVEVKFGADPRKFRPKVFAFLDHQNPEVTTTRPLLSIRPIGRRGPRYLIWREGLTNAEMLAIMATDRCTSKNDFYKAFTRNQPD